MINQSMIEYITLAVSSLLVLFFLFAYPMAFIFGYLGFNASVIMFIAINFLALTATAIEMGRRVKNKRQINFLKFEITKLNKTVCINPKNIGLLFCLICIVFISINIRLSGIFSYFLLAHYSLSAIILILPKSQTKIAINDQLTLLPLVINSIAVLSFIISLYKMGSISVGALEDATMLVGILICPLILIFQSLKTIVYNFKNNNSVLQSNGISIKFNNAIIGIYIAIILYQFYLVLRSDFATKLFGTLIILFYLFNVIVLHYQKSLISELNSQKSIVRNDKEFRYSGEKNALYFSLGLAIFIVFILLNFSVIILLLIISVSIILIKARQGHLLGQAVKVSNEQFPEVYELSVVAAERLNTKLPDIFIVQNPIINAYAIGFLGRKSIVLHSKTVSSMTKQELLSILGHELSHIKYSHTNWIVITSSISGLRIPIISDALSFIFLAWSRRAEFTADRGGMISCENLSASISALAKIAIGEELYNKLNLNKFSDQEKDVEKDIVSKLSVALSTHPYIVKRIAALNKFSNSDCFNSYVQQMP